jgi:hypothetical protein
MMTRDCGRQFLVFALSQLRAFAISQEAAVIQVLTVRSVQTAHKKSPRKSRVRGGLRTTHFPGAIGRCGSTSMCAVPFAIRCAKDVAPASMLARRPAVRRRQKRCRSWHSHADPASAAAICSSPDSRQVRSSVARKIGHRPPRVKPDFLYVFLLIWAGCQVAA